MIAFLGALAALAPAPPAAPPITSILPLGVRWTVEIPAPPVAGATPVSDARHVYLALRTGDIVARNTADGSEAWRRELPTERPLAAGDDLVFVASHDALQALRGEDGAAAWEVPSPAPTAPLVARAGWLIVMAGGKAYAYRAVDGTLVWQHDVGAVSVRPAIDGGRLYLAADDGRIIALDIKDGNQVWEQRIPEQPAEPLGSGDRVYVGGGDRHFYCLEAKNGEIAWNWRVGAAINLPPSADAERVYFVGLDNVLRALDRSSGVQKWQRAVRRRVAAGPVLLRDVVLVASESSGEIWGWTAAGAPAGVIATPAEPAVQPEFEDAGQQGARIFVVTGSLESVWRLTLITSAGDPPLVPLTELPGTMVPPAGR